MPDAVDNITDFGFAPIHIDGQRILLASHRRVYLAEEGEIVQEWETGDVGTASAILPPTLGPIPETDAFWACSETGGLQRLDAEGVTDLAPDFSASHSPCRSLDVSWDAIAYRTQDDRIGVVQLSTGARHTFDHPFFPLRAEDEDGQRRRDVIRVSPDGSFVLHAERPVNEAGHVILSQQSEIAVLPVGGLPTRIPGKLDEPRQLDSLIFRMENPWMSRGPGVFVPGDGDAHLLGFGEPIHLPHTRALAMRGEHLFVKTRKGAGLLELETGVLHHLLSSWSVDEALPFRWGGPVAFSHPTTHCIHEPRYSSDCHSYAWALSTWTVERGSKLIAWAFDSFDLFAIGPDGSVIARGHLSNSPPLLNYPFWEKDERLLLFGPDGQIVRDLTSEATVLEGLGGEHFAILKQERNGQEELVAINWKTGDQRHLAGGARIEKWSLDHSDRRLTIVMHHEAESPTSLLISGVVPSP